MRRKIVIVNSNYPSETNKYGDVFVHSRLIHYQKELDVQVIGYSKAADKDYNYTYEGIRVEVLSKKQDLRKRIESHNPDLLGFHFIEGWMVEDIVKYFNSIPIFVWVHGIEALGWYRRLFYLQPNGSSIFNFTKYVVKNTIQMLQMKKLINYSNSTSKVNFIFVSRWMKRITETDTATRIRYFSIIPNPIDSERFRYVQKDPDLRKRALLIRSFDNKKYANDIAIDSILKLSKNKRVFEDMQFAIYGKGKLFTQLVNKVKHLKNVEVVNDFVENKDIPGIHKKYGVMLCPTRQDAQGVSMCEAMSSGLVPVSSNNTAIPEFVQDGKTGFLANSSDDIVRTIEFLYDNPKEFLQISKEASTSIKNISSTESVVNAELKLFSSSKKASLIQN